MSHNAYKIIKAQYLKKVIVPSNTDMRYNINILQRMQ